MLRPFASHATGPALAGPAAATRFAGWSPPGARSLLAALVVGIASLILIATAPLPRSIYLSDDPATSDSALYGAVIDRLAAGEGYYDAVVTEHRLRGYPLRPFVTVRPPTLAVAEAWTGRTAAGLALAAVAAAAIVGLALRFRSAHPLAAPLLAACAIAPLTHPDLAVWHEVWAGLLLALSLACRARGRWAASLGLGLMAVAVRELALPYLAVMAWAAYRDGEPREAGAWAAGIALAGAWLAAHALAVAAHVSPTDLASPGWAGFGGPRLAMTMVHTTGMLAWLSLPLPVAGLAIPLAVLGWWAGRDPASRRGAMALTGYLVGFMFVGRTNNIYWGFLLSPLLLVGLAAAPAALHDLWRAARIAGPGIEPVTPRP